MRRGHLLLALAIGAAAWVTTEAAEAVPVRVRGETSVRLVAFEQSGALVIRGEVVDDVGASMPATRLEVDLGTAARRASSCTAGPGGRAELTGKRLALTADDRGAFCARVEGGPARGAKLSASVAASDLFEGAKVEATIEGDATGLVKTTLRFESPPSDVDLDRESVKLTATLGVDRADAERLAGTTLRREGIPLVVEDERGVELVRASTGGDGRARFEIATATLAGPGEGLLRVRFAGSTSLQASSASIVVNRSARVSLSLAAAPQPGDADEGIPIEVKATTSRGPVDGGIVEANGGGRALGASAVADGSAIVSVTTPGGRPGVVPVTLRFVPAAPWFVPGPDLATEVVIEPPSSLGLMGLFALVAAVGGWVLSRWRRPAKPKEAEAPASARPPGHAEVLVVASHRGARGWKGRVIDAHDGNGIEGVSVVVTRPTFEGDGVLARCSTDAQGAFEIALEEATPAEATLRVEGELHAAIEQSLPVPGELRIALVTRRRALLDRLVRWARTKGPPWDGAREPTPGHVRRLAARSEAEDVASWAGSVEQAAFGPLPVDRAAEGEVRAREPGPLAR